MKLSPRVFNIAHMNTISDIPKKKIKRTDCHPVREIRKKLKLSQSELSSLIGLKQSQLSQCELGLRNLSIKAAKRLLSIAKSHDLNYSLEFIYPD